MLDFVMLPGIDPVARWISACFHERGRLRVRLELAGRTPTQEALRVDEEVDLPPEEQARLWALWASRGERDLFESLGIEPTDDPAAIRRAYLATMRLVHPDRYFGKRLGSFAAVLVELCDEARAAYEVLADPERRAKYLLGRAAPAAD